MIIKRQEEGEDFDNADPMADNVEHVQAASAPEQPDHQETAPTVDSLDEGDWGERIPNELPVDTSWEDIYQTSASSLPSNSDDDEWDFTTRTSAGESLQAHLLWQLNLAPMSDTDRLIAVTLIDCINNQGYLDETLEEILEAFDPELDIELDEIEAVLHRIQQFEPAGIGARNLGECLLLQLRQQGLGLIEAGRQRADRVARNSGDTAKYLLWFNHRVSKRNSEYVFPPQSCNCKSPTGSARFPMVRLKRSESRGP